MSEVCDHWVVEVWHMSEVWRTVSEAWWTRHVDSAPSTMFPRELHACLANLAKWQEELPKGHPYPMYRIRNVHTEETIPWGVL